MPPWKGRLNEQQRWDVTAFMYSLHYTPAQLQSGKALYTENCAACHGDKGAGDGPKAKDSARPVTNLADSQYMTTHSDQNIYDAVTKGVGAIMPAFPQLTDEQRWAVTAYTRSLSWLDVQNPAAVNRVTYTDNPNVIRLAQVETRLDFSGNIINVQQGFSIINTDTARGFQNKDGGSVVIPLPAGATQIFLDAQMRSSFSVREGSPGTLPAIIGSRPLPPGAQQLLIVSYHLPLLPVPFKISQITAYDVGQASVVIPETSGFGIVENNFAFSRLIPDQTPDGRQTNYRQYTPSVALLGGLPFEITLDQLSKLNSIENATRRNTLGIVFGLSLVAFAVIVIGVWRIGRQSRKV
jgi:mono/diheme cytochrome c family protein